MFSEEVVKHSTVVGGAVFDDNFHGFTELVPRRVESLAHILPQRLQVHGPRDDLIVVLHNFGIHWCVERIRLQGRERRSQEEKGLYSKIIFCL